MQAEAADIVGMQVVLEQEDLVVELLVVELTITLEEMVLQIQAAEEAVET
jgi:hypothetical protein